VPRRSLLRNVFARRRVLPADAGMVTAETAVVLPVLLVVLAAAVFVLSCVGAQLRCVDAAHLAARAAARGDAPVDVTAVGRSAAPPGAQVRVERRIGQVLVLVTTEVRPFGSAIRLPPVRVSGRAAALDEDPAP
jgi:Flp pilus assembly protein TadG